jgi:hypothetical protein
MILTSRRWQLCAFVLALIFLVPSLSAVVLEERIYHGKKIRCFHSGVWGIEMLSGRRACGTQGFARVFTGTVKSAIDISDTDKLLTLIPDEIFQGDSVHEVTASVNQACVARDYPEIQSGDQWLFYLRPNQSFRTDGKATYGNNELVIPFDGPSKPLSRAGDDIAMLRHLAKSANSIIITGNVEQLGETYDQKSIPVVNHKIVAKGEIGIEYTALTNERGHYELELPPDSYEVLANTRHGLKELDNFFPNANLPDAMNRVQLQKGGCREVDFTMLTDGKIAGRITTAQGKPAGFAKVAIIPTTPVRPPFTVVADAEGHFEAGGRQPGRYLVGVGLLAPYSSEEWKSRVYYPGVATKERAKTIDLGDGEWRTDIDFKLSSTGGPQ